MNLGKQFRYQLMATAMIQAMEENKTLPRAIVSISKGGERISIFDLPPNARYLTISPKRRRGILRTLRGLSKTKEKISKDGKPGPLVNTR
jgi:hypothetical protein